MSNSSDYDRPILRRLFFALRNRLDILKRDALPDDLRIQMQLRLLVLPAASAHIELQAWRKSWRTLETLIDSDAGRWLFDGHLREAFDVDPPPGLDIDRAGFDAIAELLRLPLSHHASHHTPERSAAFAAVAEALPDIDDDMELARLAAGANLARRRTDPRHDPWVDINDAAVQRVLDQLGPVDLGDVMQRIQARRLPPRRTIAGLLASGVWATGARPNELWDLHVHLTQIPPDSVIRDFGREMRGGQPAIAWMRPGEDPTSFAGRLLRETARRGAGLLASLPNSKTANAPFATERRTLSIARLHPRQVATLVTLAELGRLGLTAQHRTNLHKRVWTILDNAGRAAFPEWPVKFGLARLRHAWIDRARHVMSPTEIAAAVGHSSRRTTSGYGEKPQRGRGRGGGGHIAVPDPAAVARLRHAWNTPQAAAAATPSPLVDTP